MRDLKNVNDAISFDIKKDRLFSATHEEILKGYTTDIYFLRAQEILRHLNLESTPVVAEIFPRREGIFAGLPEILYLLKDKNVKIWAIPEGESFVPYDTVVRIEGPYNEFGVFETPILGILASSSAWATATKECKEAAGDSPLLCFASRHVHPAVAPVLERSAKIGGADGLSCVLGAKIAGIVPKGTVPHAVFLIAGDTLKVAKAYDEIVEDNTPKIILVDTFKDEAEESLRVANLLKDRLSGIRLDTPGERGGVTPGLVREVRARLDQAGFSYVRIYVSGGLTPERIRILKEAGAFAFGVGSYISSFSPIDMTMDLKEVNGKKIAKRGRIPGKIDNPKLIQVK